MADAPTAAAKRLTQRNRLEELHPAIEAAQQEADKTVTMLEEAQTAIALATATRDEARTGLQIAQQQANETAQDLAQSEVALASERAKLQVMQTQIARLENELEELAPTEVSPEDAHQLGDGEALQQALETAREEMVTTRAALTETQADLQNLQGNRAARERRLQQIGDDRQQWQVRHQAAEMQIKALATRRESAELEREKFAAIPASLTDKRNKLVDLIVGAEKKRKAAGDKFAVGEARLAEADKMASACQTAVSAARELLAGLEAKHEAGETRRDEAGQRIRAALRIEPEQALDVSGHDPKKPFPDAENMESKLEKLRRERDNLGGVNLRAAEEASESEAQIESMIKDRDELMAAINKLRHGIGRLNREGRRRLLAAFETVNGHFGRLFQQLFGGGSAKLELTQSDDPLQAGLEIIAHPPGKKPQVISLLSGGEQALTATALIFAMFLTNPSPICVLDEVDAPLDDSNVERFCNLLKEIAEATDTRFLIITHHALTMARMDYLYGVTMQERGVSRLLSVDLSAAEQFAEMGGGKKNIKDNSRVMKSVG